MATSHAADSTTPAPEVVRLKICSKVVLPNAGPGGINEEVERWGFIDETGKVVVPTEWDSVSDFHEGIACVKRGDKLGFIDENGKIISEPQWDPGILNINGALVEGFAPTFYRGRVAVEKDNKWGCIDKSGKVVIEPQYDRPDELPIEDGRRVREDNSVSKTVYISTEGKVAFQRMPASAPQSVNFSEGMGAVKLDQGNWCLIDTNGKTVALPQWEDIRPFSCGLAAFLTKDFHAGFIDKTGKVVIEPVWDLAFFLGFEDGICLVRKSSREGAIDTSGKVLIQPEWDEIEINHGYCFAYRMVHPAFGESYAWFDKTGKMIWQSENSK